MTFGSATPCVIRADASAAIGLGHVMRTLALANVWRRRGGPVTFVGNLPAGAIPARIEAAGCNWTPLAEPFPSEGDLDATLDVLKEAHAGGKRPWLILDGYRFDAEYQRAIRAAGYPLLVIDDNAHLPAYEADVLLNQNVHAEQLTYSTSPGAVRLLGSRYVLLREEFAAWRSFTRRTARKAQRLLVTLGGSDPLGITEVAIAALRQLTWSGWEATVVAGPAHPRRTELERLIGSSSSIRLVTVNDGQMPALMAESDLALSAAGSTCWEMAFMGLPHCVTLTAENQERIAAAVERRGTAISLGQAAGLTPERIAQALTELAFDGQRRARMSALGRSLVDGSGAARVVHALSAVPLQGNQDVFSAGEPKPCGRAA